MSLAPACFQEPAYRFPNHIPARILRLAYKNSLPCIESALRVCGSRRTQRVIIGPHRASAAGGSWFPWTLLHQSCIYRRAVTTAEGMRLPLIVGPLFSAFRPTQSRFPPKRANAVVAVVSVVPVHRARGIDVADVVRVGRYKPHPKKKRRALPPRRDSSILL